MYIKRTVSGNYVLPFVDPNLLPVEVQVSLPGH